MNEMVRKLKYGKLNMFRYKITRGMWKNFFNFELPDLFFSRKKSRSMSCTKNYSGDSNLPNSIIDITLYNPTSFLNGKSVKFKLWFDPEKRVEQLNNNFYLKMSDLSFDEREILKEIGYEMKLIVFKDKSCEISYKEQSNYLFDSTLTYLKKKLKDVIHYMENWLKEQLKEGLSEINEYITLNREGNHFTVNCKGKYFWTFILEDVKRSTPLNFKDLAQNYNEWFLDFYLPHADDTFKPKKLEFSEICRLFQDWNKNGLKNIHFTYHFYSHLMHRLIENDHPTALEIYKKEVKKKETSKSNYLTEAIKTEGNWYNHFDFNIPDRFFKKEIYLSTWKDYSYDTKNLIPRSIINLELYPGKTGSIESHLFPGENLDNNVFVISYYLERVNEIKEIEFEFHTYYKYGEFLAQKDRILRDLGETIRLFINLDKTFILHFFDNGFLPQDILFKDFKEKLSALIPTIAQRS